MVEQKAPGNIPMGQITPNVNPGKVIQPNPLEKYFRQPKLYVTLPSHGNWYPEGGIELGQTGELAVYPMTARDEVTFKTPDALLNGQSTVDVIRSCCPGMKDPWFMPTIDLDSVLVAIRMATYGEKLAIKSEQPVTKEEKAFDVDLRMILDKFGQADYKSLVEHDDVKITIRPQTYREFTRTAMKTFEEQRLYQTINNSEIDDDEKLKRFNDSFSKLTAITLDIVKNTIVSIQAGDHVVSDRTHINEFIDKADKNFYTAITDHVSEQRKQFQLEPIKVQSTDEEIEKGAPATYEVPIVFDQSAFFG